jgi:hypothetical protein
MVFIGGVLALLCGLTTSAAAVLEKREGSRAAGPQRGLGVLLVLVRRGAWLFAMALSGLAWVAEAAALAMAPVPVVTTLRTAGRGALVVAGKRWLGEQFGRLELAGVVLIGVGGILTAVSAAGGGVAGRPLSDFTEVVVGAVAAGLAALLSRRGGDGLMSGAAVGVLFVATGVFTKEIGDRVARHGLHALPALLATPGPWLMVALSVWAISLLQAALLRANAATVSAANSTVASNGLILASLALYHEQLVARGALVPLAVGIVLSAVGAVALVFPARRGRADLQKR